MPDSKQDDSFRVIDRRLFNPDGGIRDEAIRDERQKQESDAAASSTGAGASAPAGKSVVVPPSQGSTPNSAERKPGDRQASVTQPADARGLKPSRGLQMLINFVAQNAAMLLGAYPDPRTGEAMLDMEGARELVDMLDALRETTRGNLASEDEKLLVDVIASLKLSFMEMTKAAAKAAMHDKGKARS